MNRSERDTNDQRSVAKRSQGAICVLKEVCVAKKKKKASQTWGAEEKRKRLLARLEIFTYSPSQATTKKTPSDGGEEQNKRWDPLDGRDDMFLGSPRRRCRPRLWPRMILLNTQAGIREPDRRRAWMAVNQKREGRRCTSSPRGWFLPLGLPRGYRISSEDPGDSSTLCAAFHPRSILK